MALTLDLYLNTHQQFAEQPVLAHPATTTSGAALLLTAGSGADGELALRVFLFSGAPGSQTSATVRVSPSALVLTARRERIAASPVLFSLGDFTESLVGDHYCYTAALNLNTAAILDATASGSPVGIWCDLDVGQTTLVQFSATLRPQVGTDGPAPESLPAYPAPALLALKSDLATLYPSADYPTEVVASAGPGPGALDMGAVAQTVAKLRAVVPLDAGIDYLECGSTVSGAILLVQNAQSGVTVSVRAAAGYTAASGPGDLDLAPGKWLALVWAGNAMTAYGNGSGSGFEALAAIQLAASTAAAIGAQGAKDTAEFYRDGAANALAATEQHADDAATAKGLTEGSRDDAATAKGLAETYRDAANTAKGLTEGYRDAANTAKGLTEGYRDAANTAKGLTEGYRDAAAAAAQAAAASAIAAHSRVRRLTHMGCAMTSGGTLRLALVDNPGGVGLYLASDQVSWGEARGSFGSGNNSAWQTKKNLQSNKPFTFVFESFKCFNAGGGVTMDAYLLLGDPRAIANPGEFTTGNNGFGFKIDSITNTSNGYITPLWFFSSDATGAPRTGTRTAVPASGQFSNYAPFHPFIEYDGAGACTFGFYNAGTRTVIQTVSGFPITALLQFIWAIQGKHTGGTANDGAISLGKESSLTTLYGA